MLSLFVLGALLAETVLTLSKAVLQLLNWIDTAICVVFIGDFAYGLARAPDRIAFLKWGWIDLVSSIPHFEVLRWGRVARVVRILRVLRALRSVRTVLKMLFARRAAGVFVITSVATFLVVAFSAIGILNLEDVPASNIRTAGDALWWSFEMLTSQSSTRYYPVTTGGRVLAVGLMFAGAAVFGTYVAAISAALVGSEEERIESEEARILAELRALRTRVDALGTQLAQTKHEEDRP